MDKTTMPEMPEMPPALPYVWTWIKGLASLEAAQRDYYTADQLRAYAAAAVAMERKRAAACVPTNWLDPLLTGPQAVIASGIDEESIERLLLTIRERIRQGSTK